MNSNCITLGIRNFHRIEYDVTSGQGQEQVQNFNFILIYAN